MEVLARVSLRATTEEAKKLFLLAMEIGQAPHHFWLYDALKHLIQFSLESIPKKEHCYLLLNALKFPLSSEANHLRVGDWRWPNPTIHFPGDREAGTDVDQRIEQLIQKVSPDSTDRKDALIRLFPLVHKGFLRSSEEKKLADQLWGTIPNYDSLPIIKDLYLSTYLILPSPDKERSDAIIKRKLFEANEADLLNIDLLNGLTLAAINNEVYPTEEQAALYFKLLTAWQPEKNRITHQDRNLPLVIGNALSYSVIPALSQNALNKENFTRLNKFIKSANAPLALIGIPYFRNSIDSNKIKELIRKNFITSVKHPEVQCYAAEAVLSWRELDDASEVHDLIALIIARLGVSQMRVLPKLISVVERLLQKNYLNNEESKNLTSVVPLLFNTANYGEIHADHESAADISLVRANCVRLANELINKLEDSYPELERIIKESKSDPLPEVRYALENIEVK
ncbi:hypothetical protein N9V90_01780 [Endozoicomonas sp.]|nr:hypothetical protein [Endozoicomonas sp.]